MAVQSYAIEIVSINIHKFGSLKAGVPLIPDKINSLNIMPQVQEVTVYESIFTPMIKCELAVYDFIGLFTNFPLSGEEIVIVEYRNVGDSLTQKWTFAIDSIRDISPDNKNRALAYVISCTHIEGLANNLGTVQQAYNGTCIQIAKNIFDEHILKRINEFYPSYVSPNIFLEDLDTKDSTIVVPNMHPLAAIDMVQILAVSETPSKYTYLFYQNKRGFHFKTLQGLMEGNAQRAFASRNRYKYFSDEITEKESKLNNSTRIISNLTINKRHSSAQKVATGYFNNNLFEINIAQKAIHATKPESTTVDQSTSIYPNKLNTQAYMDWAKSFSGDEEKSNRTKYVVTTYREQDKQFPVSMARHRWGLDLISKIALNQIELTVTIPGTNAFAAGDMFYLEIPQFHGFNNMDNDELISGFYLITDIKHIIHMGGFHTTVLKINKDSYKGSVDAPSKYV